MVYNGVLNVSVALQEGVIIVIQSYRFGCERRGFGIEREFVKFCDERELYCFFALSNCF